MWEVIEGDCREVLRGLADGSVQTCVTSPPYFGLRDYGVDGQIGAESTLDAYVAELVGVFREVRRVLADDGTVWLNLGDTYASACPCNRRNVVGMGSLDNGKRENRPPRLPNGLKEKDLIGVPWRVAFALQADGWYLRSDIVWHKPNPMPESVRDRPTKAHEYVFLLTKSPRYYYDAEAIKEAAVTGSWDAMPPIGGKKHTEGNDNHTYSGNQPALDGKRNKRTVWTITPKPFKGAHFAVMPPALVEPCILAGSRPGDLVLDPFNGAGTVGVVALTHGRRYVGIELNPEYAAMARERITRESRPRLLAG